MPFKESPHGRYKRLDISPSRLKKWLTCPKQYEYHYVRRIKSNISVAALQGTSLHDVFLEEYLAGGEQNHEALLSLMDMMLADLIESDEPHDYRTGFPITEKEAKFARECLQVWARGFLETWETGKTPYGTEFEPMEVAETEVEKEPLEIHLPKTGITIRLRGYIDFINKDGSAGDLKLATDYYAAKWSLARAVTEVQPTMYRMMMGSPGKFTYLIAEKRMNKKKEQIYSPEVFKVELEITEKDFDKMIEYLEDFVVRSDIANGHENGTFLPTPIYAGEPKWKAGKHSENFCGHLCSFKGLCYQENFSPIRIGSDSASV